MKPVLFLCLFFSTYLWADEAADRVAIEGIIQSLNQPYPKLPPLFTSDANIVEFARLQRFAQFIDSTPPMSEVTSPRIVVRSIQFPNSQFATVDAAKTQFGSQKIRIIPVFFLMERQGPEWRITFLRVTTDKQIFGAMAYNERTLTGETGF